MTTINYGMLETADRRHLGLLLLALYARHSLRPSFRSTFNSGNLTACLRTGIYSAFSPLAGDRGDGENAL